MPSSREQIQESLSQAYLHLVTCTLGLVYFRPQFDMDGTDYVINYSTRVKGQPLRGRFPLYIQLKSSTMAEVKENTVVYDLTIKAYDELRRPRQPGESPMILVLLVLPEDEAVWMDLDEERLLIRKCAYWISLEDWPESDTIWTKRINIPRTNVFSVDGLRDIMDRIAQCGQV
jgi:Domain of unknown function (DUF4365)